MNQLLIIFLKSPQKGKVKTRLAKSIGQEKALALYTHLVNHTIKIGQNPKWTTQLHFANSEPHLPNPFQAKTYTQNGINLGERMFNSIRRGLLLSNKVVLIGADIPRISTQIIEQAFMSLDKTDVVFGPSVDGGYYLIGMKKPLHQIFQLSAWSHKQVLNESMSLAKQNNLSYSCIQTLMDVDLVEDLSHFSELLKWV